VSKINTRTIVALLTVGLLAVVVATAGVLFVALRDAEPRDPEITAYAHGKTVIVPPFEYCTIRMQDCRHTGTVELPVPAGYPLQLSFPDEIAQAPWQMQQVYQLPSGEKVADPVSHNKFDEGARAITVDSRPEPDLRLIGIELQLPIPARDEAGNEFWVPHATWSIKTA